MGHGDSSSKGRPAVKRLAQVLHREPRAEGLLRVRVDTKGALLGVRDHKTNEQFLTLCELPFCERSRVVLHEFFPQFGGVLAHFAEVCEVFVVEVCCHGGGDDFL